jgi:tetratricopeptide (TPR) repeat protein
MTAESPTLDDPSKEACETADKLIEQAKALNPLDGEVWAKEALNDLHIIGLGYDRSPARMGNAAAAATRAMELNPNSYAARSAHAQVIHYVVAPPGGSSEAEHLLRELLSENPNDLGNQITLAHVLRSEGRFGEAADFCMKVNLPLLAAYIYLDAERFDKANAAADQALKMKRSVMNLQCKILMMQIAEDRNAALSLIDEIPPSAYTDDKIAEALALALLLYREPEKALKVLNSFPRDWMVTWTYSIPKAAYKGTAHMLAGRLDAARAEWNVALQQIERKLSDEPNNPVLLTEKASILA